MKCYICDEEKELTETVTDERLCSECYADHMRLVNMVMMTKALDNWERVKKFEGCG